MAITHDSLGALPPGRQMRIGFLLIDGFALMSYAAAVEPFRAANLLAGGTPPYLIRHIPARGAVATSSGGAEVPGSAVAGRDLAFDLVLVVAGGDPFAFADPHVLGWLRQLDRRGVALGGVSGGPAVLARAGLMAGRRMTLHWEHIAAMAERDPGLMLERTLYVMDRDRLTCAGGAAALDMMHMLITLHRGGAFARQVSDWFLHTEVRAAGGPQRSGLIERYGSTNPVVLAAIEAMETHIADPLSLGQLAHVAGVGPRQLVRLFGQELGQSPMVFCRSLRLEKARALVTGAPLSLTEVAQATGFATSAHFSRSFAETFGLPPSRMRRREVPRANGPAGSRAGQG